MPLVERAIANKVSVIADQETVFRIALFVSSNDKTQRSSMGLGSFMAYF
jgi:hypothetical protein